MNHDCHYSLKLPIKFSSMSGILLLMSNMYSSSAETYDLYL
jgi:hypothetical protein